MLWTNKSMADTNFCKQASGSKLRTSTDCTPCLSPSFQIQSNLLADDDADYVLSCPVLSVLSPGGSINTSGFCLGCGFFFHSINIRRARSAGASSSRQFVQTPLLAHLGNYVVHSNPAIDIATNPASTSSPPARLRTAITMMRERYRVAPKRPKPTNCLFFECFPYVCTEPVLVK
jgi:hypothetical protein